MPARILRKQPPPSSGFTLIEMMVVVAVIALLTLSVAPMVFETMTATRITSAGESLAAQLSLGHQLAVSGNQDVEVRFYEYDDPNEPGSGRVVHAVVLMRSAGNFSPPAGGTVLAQQLTDTFYLPSGIVVASGAKLSPPLYRLTANQDREGVIKKSGSATYRAFHFYPDGSTDLPQNNLPANQCYFTIGEGRLMAAAANSIPKNFYAVQVDPNTGRTVTYRP